MFLAGYWRYHRVNFLDYITIHEVIARSAFNVVPVLLFSGGLIIVTVLISRSVRLNALIEKKEKETMARLRLGQVWMNPWFRKLGPPIVLLGFGGCGFIYGYVRLHSAVDGLVLAMPLVFSMVGGPLIGALLPKVGRPLGTVVSLIVGSILAFNYLWGGILAELRDKGGLGYEWCSDVITDVDPEIKALVPEYFYAGRMGGYIFLASKTKQGTLAIPEGRVKMLITYKKKAPNKPPLQTPTSGTPAAGAPVAPPSSAAGL
jgi:hypothetical protein